MNGRQPLHQALQVPNVEGRLSDTILLDMWEKWVMLATMAGISCLMRATSAMCSAPVAADFESL